MSNSNKNRVNYEKKSDCSENYNESNIATQEEKIESLEVFLSAKTNEGKQYNDTTLNFNASQTMKVAAALYKFFKRKLGQLFYQIPEIQEVMLDLIGETMSRILEPNTKWDKTKHANFEEFFLIILDSEIKNFISNHITSKNRNLGKRVLRYERLIKNDESDEIEHHPEITSDDFNYYENKIIFDLDFELYYKKELVRKLKKNGKSDEEIDLFIRVFELQFKHDLNGKNKEIAEILGIPVRVVENINKVIKRIFKPLRVQKKY